MAGNFERQLEVGKIGEGIIASWLRTQKGYNVLPVYEKEIHEGKGPVLFGIAENLIAPDLLCFRSADNPKQYTIWIEAKTKSAFTWHRITERWTTGIDLRHYEHYQKVAELSPFPVWLLFLHLRGRAKDTPDGMTCPDGLFGNSLDYLTQHENHRHDGWGRSGMVYWAHEHLQRLAELDALQPTSARKL